MRRGSRGKTRREGVEDVSGRELRESRKGFSVQECWAKARGCIEEGIQGEKEQ